MTAQLPDRIIYHLEYFNLCTNPLEPYWTGRRKKRPKFCGRENCKRGYIATWEIRQNQLFLYEIEGTLRKTFRLWGAPTVNCTVRKLFGRRKTSVKAEWFSGRLRIPIGKMILFVDQGYDSRFEREIIITVEKGDVTRIVTLDNKNKTVVINEGSLLAFR